MNRNALDPPAIVKSVVSPSEMALDAAIDELNRVGSSDLQAHWRVGELLDPLEMPYKDEKRWVKFLKKKGLSKQTAIRCLIIYRFGPISSTVELMGVVEYLKFIRKQSGSSQKESEPETPIDRCSSFLGKISKASTEISDPEELADLAGELRALAKRLENKARGTK